MKKKIKKIIELFVLILMIIIAYFGCSFILNRQLSANEIRVRNFYKEKKDSLDLVFIGSSSVYTSYSTPVAWKEQGFTSYVLATSGAPMGIMKSMVIEVQKRQNPKLIVIDMNGVIYNDKSESKEGSLRFWIDNMPYSKNKIETINYLIPEKERDSYFNPFKKYHGNWEKIKNCLNFASIEMKTSLTKDYLSLSGMTGVARYSSRKDKTIDVHSIKAKKDIEPLAKKHLYDLLDYLKENEIENVVFYNSPKYYNKKTAFQREKLNEAADIIKKYGYEIYDLDYTVESLKLDKNKDFYDDVHVNVYGQKKVTEYLAKTFNKKYQLTREYDQSVIDKWNKEYQGYEKVCIWIKDLIQAKKYKYFDIRDFQNLIFE